MQKGVKIGFRVAIFSRWIHFEEAAAESSLCFSYSGSHAVFCLVLASLFVQCRVSPFLSAPAGVHRFSSLNCMEFARSEVQ